MPLSPAADYVARTLTICTEAAEAELPRILAAAELIATRVSQGGVWWIFGTGHSHLLAEELWGRAGGLVEIRAILEPALMLHEGLEKSSRMERLAGLGAELVALHGIRSEDVVTVISNSGRNAVPVEFAHAVSSLGAAVIALTSVNHSRSVTSRAPSGRKLFELAEVVIDNHGVPGDAVVPTPDGMVGATSTAVGALLLQALSVEVTFRLRELGHPAPTYVSLNA
ncbi:sugar isomerase domain-containing protein [Microbacterium sp. A94]|uniref:sugar isomerase domain-containing protein n=1 Tax=Microbacterium sp. A94 TaxID=3450717 RepID=UPI003F433D07